MSDECCCPDCVSRVLVDKPNLVALEARIIAWWKSLDPDVQNRVHVAGKNWRAVLHPDVSPSAGGPIR